MKKIGVILLVVLIGSCSFFKKKKVVDKDVIARVNDEYLYASDVQGLTKGMNTKDSLQVLRSFADNWVKKKLLLQKATENIPDDDVGITRKVEDYRQTLVLYEYEKALVNKRLDTVIKQNELDEWYEKMKADMPLDKDVYLVFFIRLKKDAPNLDNARKLINKPRDEEDMIKLEGYCREYAGSYKIDNGVWYDRESLAKNFQLSDNDINAIVNTKGYKEFKAGDDIWFVKIEQVMKKDQPAPLQFVRDKLVRAIIEKRRLQLIEKIYDKIYQDGLKAKSFEILVNG